MNQDIWEELEDEAALITQEIADIVTKHWDGVGWPAFYLGLLKFLVGTFVASGHDGERGVQFLHESIDEFVAEAREKRVSG
jgi:hypothetical protein